MGPLRAGRAPRRWPCARQRVALSAPVCRSPAAGGRREEPRAATASSPRQAPPLSPPPRRGPRSSLIRSPGPRRAGPLVWPAEAERDLREPRRPPTGDQRDSRDSALPRAAASPVLARTLGSAPPRRGGSGDSRAAAPGESEPRPRLGRLGRLGAGGGGGGGGGKCASSREKSFTSRRRLRLPVAEKSSGSARRGSLGFLAMERRSGPGDARSPALSLCIAA